MAASALADDGVAGSVEHRRERACGQVCYLRFEPGMRLGGRDRFSKLGGAAHPFELIAAQLFAELGELLPLLALGMVQRAGCCALFSWLPDKPGHQTVRAAAESNGAVVSYIRAGAAKEKAGVTNPQNPFEQNPFSYDPLGRVPFADPPAGPPVFTPPPALPYRPPVNTLATLSLVLAFVFAPAGAILGHLGLAQIRRTGELGRDRALAGLALSYGFITLAVVALVGWATLAAFTSTSNRTAAPATITTAPPLPTVAPDTIAALLPGLDALKNISGDQNLEAGPTRDHPGKPDGEETIDRPDCWGSIAAGVPDAYTVDAIAGYRAEKFSDARSFLKSIEIMQAVLAFRDPPTAQSQLAKLLSGWSECGGSTVGVAIQGVGPIPYSLSAPADGGNGITTMDLAPKGLQVRSVRAVAAKANVVVDLCVTYGGTTDSDRPRQSAVSIANYILDKIPG